MKKLMYAPDALEKLQIMKQDITDRHGAEGGINLPNFYLIE